MIDTLAHHTPLHTDTVNVASLVLAIITAVLLAAGFLAVSRINKD